MAQWPHMQSKAIDEDSEQSVDNTDQSLCTAVCPRAAERTLRHLQPAAS